MEPANERKLKTDLKKAEKISHLLNNSNNLMIAIVIQKIDSSTRDLLHHYAGQYKANI